MAAVGQKRRVVVLGATGSIGDSTLDVIARNEAAFEIFGLTAHSNLPKLLDLCRRFRPRIAVLTGERAGEFARAVRDLGLSTEVHSGKRALEDLVSDPHVDDVMAAIVGGAGLPATWAAVRAGKRVLLANKESLVMGGDLITEEARRSGATIVPIDSEHNAIFQSLPANYREGPDAAGVRRIILTASGGPFRRALPDSLAHVTPEEACAHPRWQMGRKISVDSATMMNKGLEVIEAHWLFGLPPERIDVLVHPQSVVHSMVEYLDGSVIAQLGNPDMRTPIAHALAHPRRVESGVARLDLAAIGRLDFEPPDMGRFPCLALAYAALRQGGCAPVVLNAANEIAVAAFLDRRISFLGIAEIVEWTLGRLPSERMSSVEDVFEVDARARSAALAYVDGRRGC